MTSCAVDPGVVNTALYQHLWTPLRLVHGTLAPWFLRVTLLLLFSPKKKIRSVIFPLINVISSADKNDVLSCQNRFASCVLNVKKNTRDLTVDLKIGVLL